MQVCTQPVGMAQQAGATQSRRARQCSQALAVQSRHSSAHGAQQLQRHKRTGPCFAASSAQTVSGALGRDAAGAWQPQASVAVAGCRAPAPCCLSRPTTCQQHASSRRAITTRAIGTAAASAAAPAVTAAAAAATTATAAPTGAGAVLAVVLGWCVMVGSLFRSVPQITKILQARTTEGLSLTSNVVELLCYTVILAYNLSQGYAFNTFGEVWACWLQDIMLVGLIYCYTRMPLWQVLSSTALFAASCAWLLGSCPPGALASLQASTIVIMALGSRVPQIVLNVKRGDAGVLSVTTCLLNVAGNVARAFTTVVLTGDMLLLSGVVVQGALNGILLYQSVQTEQAKRGPGPAAVPAPA